MIWLLLAPVLLVLGVLGGLELLFRAARRGFKQRYWVEVRGVPQQVDIYTGHWLGKLLPMNGVADRGAVWLDRPGTAATGGVKVTPLDALVHELVHALVQAPRMGLGYRPTYLWHRLVLRRAWKDHMMEREAVRLTAAWFAGDRSVLGDLPRALLVAYPHRMAKES